MKTLVSILLVAVFLAAFSFTSVTAQDSDLLGVFFDESGDQTSVETTAPYEPVPFYIVLLEPSHDEGIYAWECILEGRTEGAPPVMFGWQLAGNAGNGDVPPRFLVALTTPLPPAAAVVLASGQVIVPDTETEILFYLHPYDPPSLQNPPGWGYPVTTPLYAHGDDLYQSLGWTSGCEAEPVARINDDGDDPIWSLGELPEEIIFGYVPAGETMIRSVSIDNTGDVALSGQIGISGDGFMYRYRYDGYWRNWSADSQWFRIEPGHHETLQVRLESGTDEEYTGELAVTVCGETSAIDLVMEGTWSACVVDPPVLDFGEVSINNPGSETLDTWIHNQGTVDLWLAVREDCSDFEVAPPNSGSWLPAGESARLWVTFDPSSTGPQTCIVSLGNEVCEELVCMGVGVDLPHPPYCVVFPEAWYFGGLAIGDTAQTEFNVVNTGGQLLEGEASIPQWCSEFSITDGAGPFSIAHDDTHRFTVVFKPHEEGHVSCAAVMTADCADIGLDGTGFASRDSCVVEPEAIDFGSVWIGYSVQRDLTIRNLGNVAVTGDLALKGYGVTIPSGFLLEDGGPFTLQPGDQQTFWIRFTPPGIGQVNGFLTTGLSGVPTVPLTARGIECPGVCWHYENGDAEIISTAPAGGTDLAIVKNDFAYIMGGSGFAVYDITNPLQARWVGGYHYDSGYYSWNAQALAVNEAGTCVYLQGSERRGVPFHWVYISYLVVVDVSDPENPWQVSYWAWETGISFPANLVASGDYLIRMMAGPGPPIYGVINLYDISDPHNPDPMGGIAGIGLGSTFDATIVDKYIYVACDQGFTAIDISDPYNIVEAGSLPLEQPGRSLVVDGDLAYVTDGDLLVIDISDPMQPVVVGGAATPGDSHGVFANGGFVYVADGESGVQIFEAGPSCSFVGAMDTPGTARQIDLSSYYGYVGDGDGMHTIWQQCGTDARTAMTMDGVPVAALRLAIHPNPFNPQTTIVCEIPQPGAVRLRIFDLRGRLVTTLVDEVVSAGRHEIIWNGTNTSGRGVSSGVYVSRLETGGEVRYGRMTLVR